MNDDFLIHFYKAPRRQFSEALYQHLSSKNKEQAVYIQTIPWIKRIALALTVLCLAFGAALAVSPAARAKLADVIHDLGGVLFTETADYPGDDHASIIPDQAVSLAEARDLFPYPFDIPTWAPEGFVLQSEVRVWKPTPEFTLISMQWKKTGEAGSSSIVFSIQTLTARGTIVGPNSLQEVQVKGQPAGLVQGGWNADSQQWDNSQINIQTLYWKQGQVTYELMAHNQAVPSADLIWMADSVP